MAVSVYPVPALSTERPEKVATPELAERVAVPDKEPELGLVPMAKLMLAEEEVVFPPASCTTITGEVLQAVPPDPPAG